MFFKSIFPVCFVLSFVHATPSLTPLTVKDKVVTPNPDVGEVVLSDPLNNKDLERIQRVDASKSRATKVILHTRFLQKAADFNTLTLEVNANQEVVLKADQGDSVFNLINPREQVYQAFLGQNGSETGLLTIKGSAKKITLE